MTLDAPLFGLDQKGDECRVERSRATLTWEEEP
jgi:hypothetical protein